MINMTEETPGDRYRESILEYRKKIESLDNSKLILLAIAKFLISFVLTKGVFACSGLVAIAKELNHRAGNIDHFIGRYDG